MSALGLVMSGNWIDYSIQPTGLDFGEGKEDNKDCLTPFL